MSTRYEVECLRFTLSIVQAQLEKSIELFYNKKVNKFIATTMKLEHLEVTS